MISPKKSRAPWMMGLLAACLLLVGQDECAPVSLVHVRGVEADQVIPVDTATPVRFSTIVLDTKGEWDPLTSTFVPSVTGIYQIQGSVTFGTASWVPGNEYSVEVAVDGQGQGMGVNVGGALEVPTGTPGPRLGVDVTTLVTLEAGDQVQIRTQHGCPTQDPTLVAGSIQVVQVE